MRATKFLLLLIVTVLLLAACGGAATTEVVAAGRTAQARATPKTSTPQAKTPISPSQTPVPVADTRPAIHCSLDDSVPKVSCTATGLKDDAKATWSSNVSGTWYGRTFEFDLDEEWKLVPELQIALEVCDDSGCKILETLIDAAHLVPEASMSTTASPTTSATAPAPAPAPTPAPPPAQKLILPFQIADSYNAAEKSYGELSYAGGFVIGAYGGGFGANVWMVKGMKNPGFLLEVVPGTVLLAAGSGTVGLVQQDYYEGEIDPEGVYNNDWELLLYLDDGLYFVIYDHVVDLLVEDGQRVEQGDPLARARPARVGVQDCFEDDPECRILSTKRPVDWLEWGLKRMVGPNGERMEGGEPWSVCWEPFLTPEHQQFLQDALAQMALLDFRSGDSACLTDEFRDDHSSDTLTSW